MSSLNKLVLVLNKIWMPIRVATVQRCFKLVFSEKAMFVEHNNYSLHRWDEWVSMGVEKGHSYVQSSRGKVRVPEIVILSHCDRIFAKNIRLTKENIYRRDSYICQYSGEKLSKEDADIDHVVPKSRGGANSWNNLVVCSKSINRKKGNKTPSEIGISLIRKPEKPINNRLMVFPEITDDYPISWSRFKDM